MPYDFTIYAMKKKYKNPTKAKKLIKIASIF